MVFGGCSEGRLHPNPSASMTWFRFNGLTLWPLSPALKELGTPFEQLWQDHSLKNGAHQQQFEHYTELPLSRAMPFGMASA